MELVKHVYQTFGGGRLEIIFNKYLLLSLLFKQLIFSLFTAPTAYIEIVKENNLTLPCYLAEASVSTGERNKIIQLMLLLQENTETPAAEGILR